MKLITDQQAEALRLESQALVVPEAGEHITHDQAFRRGLEVYEAHILAGAIRAKAVRKKGTKEWYEFDAGWAESGIPMIYPISQTVEMLYPLPDGAELVEVLIIKEGGEG